MLTRARPRVRRKFTRLPCGGEGPGGLQAVGPPPSAHPSATPHTLLTCSMTMYRPWCRITPRSRTRFLCWSFLGVGEGRMGGQTGGGGGE